MELHRWWMMENSVCCSCRALWGVAVSTALCTAHCPGSLSLPHCAQLRVQVACLYCTVHSTVSRWLGSTALCTAQCPGGLSLPHCIQHNVQVACLYRTVHSTVSRWLILPHCPQHSVQVACLYHTVHSTMSRLARLPGVDIFCVLSFPLESTHKGGN